MRIILKIWLPLLLTTFFVYLPYIANPDLLFGRHNDLTEFFWPIIYYIKESVVIHKQIPLWNNMFFMGTPLISDPQNLFWYLPNIIFLFTSVNLGILITYIVHTLFGGIGSYLASKELKLSQSAAIFVACLFIASPKLVGYIEAGHFGLVLAFAWFPWIIYGIKKITTTPHFKWSTLLAVGFSSLYFNHILTAFIAGLASLFLGLFLYLKKPNRKVVFAGLVNGILFLVLIFPAFLSQQEWFPQTTRDLLLKHPDVFPKWTSKIEFLTSIIYLRSLDTEKILTFGSLSLILGILGFLKLNRKLMIVLVAAGSVICLLAANNASPLYPLLLKMDWYVLMRVATRFWFILTLLVIFLAGYGFDILQKKRKWSAYILATFAVLEVIFVGYKIITKPISISDGAPIEIYTFLSTDKDVFRVFCTTRCLSQKEVAKHNLHLADGYGTLQQKNYFEAAKQIGQYYSSNYSLAIPPFDIYLYQKLQPHAPTLTAYDIKYVISQHPLTDTQLLPIETYAGYTIYLNTLYQAPTYTYYSPNKITIDNSQALEKITVGEIYNSNWQAFDDNGNHLPTSETKDHTIEIATNKAKLLHLRFLPYKKLFNSDIK